MSELTDRSRLKIVLLFAQEQYPRCCMDTQELGKDDSEPNFVEVR